MIRQRFFITGTDTEVGKTFCTTVLLKAAQDKGCSTLGLKPLAAGCEETAEGLRNEDALALMSASTVKLEYDQVNPVRFIEPIAPHIAALRNQQSLSVDRLTGFVRGTMMTTPVDFVCVEGAGGWRLPLNGREYLSALPQQLNIPVILVVGMRLGCLNHALLTVEAIQRDGVKLAGWIANRIDADMSCYEENLDSLKTRISAPCLGEIPFSPNAEPENLTQHIDLSLIP